MCDVEHACATTDRLIKEADNHMYEEKSILKKNFYAVRSKK